jgi:hypothetical protein
VLLSDIQAVAARSQFLVRITLDYLYPPYNTWSACGGQSASELAQIISYLDTWPRNKILIDQPVGCFNPCDVCDLKTLAYLMYQANGWCKPPAFTDPPVVCTNPSEFVLAPDTSKPATPTSGPNLQTFVLTTEGGRPLVADNGSLVPCYRDWVALGLGNPPSGKFPLGCGNSPWPTGALPPAGTSSPRPAARCRPAGNC